MSRRCIIILDEAVTESFAALILQQIVSIPPCEQGIFLEDLQQMMSCKNIYTRRSQPEKYDLFHSLLEWSRLH